MRSFFFTAPATTVTYTLSLHDALPISENTIGVLRIFHQWPGREPLLVSQLHPAKIQHRVLHGTDDALSFAGFFPLKRSEEHTSELQSHVNLVCRLLLEKKNIASMILNC